MVRAKKHLGQHFLKNESICYNICQSINHKHIDQIIEVGPGTGVLTKYLILDKNIEFTVVEIDEESIEFLQKNYGDLHIINGDFLKLDLSSYTNLVIIGNFPYYISTQIVFKVIENFEIVNQMIGMFQKEVAERICAPSGSKVYGILSVLTQIYYDTEYLFTVDEDEFVPPPKVKSAVIRLSKKEIIPIFDYRLLKSIVKQAFNQRRKTLRNSLKSFNIENHFDENFLRKRPEELDWKEFLKIENVLRNNKPINQEES